MYTFFKYCKKQVVFSKRIVKKITIYYLNKGLSSQKGHKTIKRPPGQVAIYIATCFVIIIYKIHLQGTGK